jgi:hypothetical protein
VAAAVGQCVVGHHAFDDGGAEGGEVFGGASREVGTGAGFLVGVDLGVGQTGVVVDRGVDVVVADPVAVAGLAVFEAVAAVDAPAAATEPADRSSQARRCRLWRVSTAWMVEAGMPGSGARRSPGICRGL